MNIQRALTGLPGQLRGPAVPAAPTPAAEGEHHHHGLTGTLMHVGHDAAMIAMSVPGGHHHQAAPPLPEDMVICGGGAPAPAGHDHAAMDHSAHAGHGGHTPAPPSGGHEHHSPGGGGNWLHHGSAAVSGLVAVGAAVHGVQMLGSSDNFTRLEGANHLLMSASSGVMAASMWAPGAGLGGLSTGLMAAHGLGEVALGAYQLSRGVRDNCQHDQLGGLLKTVHGGCLAAAQAFPGAALPLYLGMTAATMAQLSLQQSGLAH